MLHYAGKTPPRAGGAECGGRAKSAGSGTEKFPDLSGTIRPPARWSDVATWHRPSPLPLGRHAAMP